MQHPNNHPQQPAFVSLEELKFENKPSCKDTKRTRNKMSFLCYCSFVCLLLLCFSSSLCWLRKDYQCLSHVICAILRVMCSKSVEERMQGRPIIFLSVLTTGLWAAALWQMRRPLYGVWSCRIGVEWTESLHMVTQTSSTLLSCSTSLCIVHMYGKQWESWTMRGIERNRWERERRKRWYWKVSCSF